MNKLIGVFLCLACTLTLCISCADEPEQDPNENLELLENQGTPRPDRMLQKEKDIFFTSDAVVDSSPIDLTGLDSLMAYGAVYEMILAPQEYVGRDVKMQGTYYAEYYESTGEYYHYVVVEDAQACCKQGLEFVLTGEHMYPDEYPANETPVLIDGTFGYYEVGQSRVPCILTDSIQLV